LFEKRDPTGHFIMVQVKNVLRKVLVVLVTAMAMKLSAQGTAFSYQGRLYDSGSPANTNYDFRFAVYDVVTNGTPVSGFITNKAVAVSGGMFSVVLNFGAGVFNGTANGSNDFLDIAVRATNVAAFTALTPRQPILPVPYAMFATSASNLLGRLPSSVFSGNYSNYVNFPNSTNTFTGIFSGNGSNLTSLNAANVSSGTLDDARLSGNVAFLNRNPQTFSGANTFSAASTFNGTATFGNTAAFNGASTFANSITSSGANTFTGVNTFTNLANTFNGNFFGNGMVGWTATNSTAFTAQFDHGYLLTSPSLVTVTLPTSINVGDIIRVAGGGTGGWLIKCGASQTIVGNFASYSNCVMSQLSSSDCFGVACSADGVVIFDTPTAGLIYFTEYFLAAGNWNSPVNVNGAYYSIACSANGKIVYAEKNSNGPIIKSTDGGLTFPSTNGTGNGTGISCTADGSTFYQNNIACSGNGAYRAQVSGGQVQISINNGAFGNVTTAPATGITAVGCSSDCTKLIAAKSGGLLYASSDQGKNWTALTSVNRAWSSVWMSPDGSKFAASVNSGSGSGGVYYCNVSSWPNTSTISGGTICGSRGAAVELQCVATGVFMPISSTGLIWAN
jgi:hypothetical protein